MIPNSYNWTGGQPGQNSPWGLERPYMGLHGNQIPNAQTGNGSAFTTGQGLAPLPQQIQPTAQTPPPQPAPISPLLAMAMQQQMGIPPGAQGGMPQSQGMPPGGQGMPSGGQYQNFIPPIQATPFNYQGGQQQLPMGGMWNQVAQQMAGPGFMQPGTSAMYSGFNPSLVAPAQGPHTQVSAPAPTTTTGSMGSLSPYLTAMGY